ncbi:unnamed protein product, partial [Prorocentrum cordatum]
MPSIEADVAPVRDLGHRRHSARRELWRRSGSLASSRARGPIFVSSAGPARGVSCAAPSQLANRSGQPHGRGGRRQRQPRVVEIEDDDTSSEDCRRSAAAAEAVAAARARNAGLPRIGCTPLAWRRPGASDVRIAGSWDGWVRQLALEPLPQGGFGIILALPRGDYECKFIVDGDWMSSEAPR